jgi:hypothetical protein
MIIFQSFVKRNTKPKMPKIDLPALSTFYGVGSNHQDEATEKPVVINKLHCQQIEQEVRVIAMRLGKYKYRISKVTQDDKGEFTIILHFFSFTSDDANNIDISQFYIPRLFQAQNVQFHLLCSYPSERRQVARTCIEELKTVITRGMFELHLQYHKMLRSMEIMCVVSERLGVTIDCIRLLRDFLV